MLTKFFVSAVLTCLTVLLLAQPSQALTCGTWKDAEKSVRTWWSQAYPKEAILSIAQNGPPRTYSKTQSTNQKQIDEYGNEWEYYKNNPYCSVPAKITVQQSSGQRIFSVSAIFKVSGKKFTFDEVATGGSEAVLEPGQAAAPDKDEIKKLITDAYMSNIPPDLQKNIQVEKVMISPRELRPGDGGQANYQMKSVDLYLIIDGAHKKKCEASLVELYKGEKNNMRLDADGPWKINFRVADDISRCADNYRNQVSDFINHVEPKKPTQNRKKSVEPEAVRDSSETKVPKIPNMLKGFGF